LKLALTPTEKARAELWLRIADARQQAALAKDRERVEAEMAKAARLKAERLARDQGDCS
jgi:hypothetical protein